MVQFSGSFSPRPPATTFVASATSGRSPPAPFTSRILTFQPSGSMDGVTVSTAPSFGFSSDRNVLPRRLAIFGDASRVRVVNTLPAYIGRVMTSSSPSTSSPVTSVASGTSSFAATRGARSRPAAVAGNRIAK